MDIRRLLHAPLYLSLSLLPLFMPRPGVAAGQGAPGAGATELRQLFARTARAIARADEAGCLWRDTEAILSSARHQQDQGLARRQARQAGRQARLALSQCRLEHARYRLGRIDPERLDRAHKRLYRDLQMAVHRRDADTAQRLLQALTGAGRP